MGKWGNKKFSIIFISCLLCMLLLFYALIEMTFAWLYNTAEKDNTGTSQLGHINSGSDAITSTTSSFEFTLGAQNSTFYLNDKVKIKNTGNLDALVRVFYSISIDETQKLIATTAGLSHVSINNAFVASDENISNVFAGHYYYNSTLEPNGEVSFINSVTPTSELANKKIKLNIIAEFINYNGGAYQLGQDLPWKNTPAKWAFNHNNITKSAGSIISPKIDIAFSNIGKLEITAKTTSTTQNILFSRYNEAYIGINGGAWASSGFTDLTATLTAPQFTNGDYNTVTFTWSAVSASEDYITLVLDNTWSKEISYKQIKIWNLAGELVYDLRPNIVKNSETSALVCDGTFANYASGTAIKMNMYSVSGNTLTSTANAYIGTSQVVAHYEFEEGNVPTCSFGASASLSNESYYYGTKSLKIVNSKNTDTITDSSTARVGNISFTPIVGYKYNISVWIKTTAPSGALTHSKGEGVLFGELPALALNSVNGANSNIKANYTGNSNWTLISISTPVITTTDSVSYYISIPTGTSYVTYIDDLVVRMYK